MGGRGSTRWNGHKKRTLLEDCLALDLAPLRRAGLFDREEATVHLEWRKPLTDEVLSEAAVGVSPAEDDQRYLVLGYVFTEGTESRRICDKFILEGLRPPKGGVRWYLRCPGLPEGRPCNRRVLKLYSPPGTDHYRCRHCCRQS